MSERLRNVELSPELVSAYAETFIPRFDRYPIQQPNGKYIQIKKPLTTELIHAHLTNYHRNRPPVTLSAYALDPDSCASWICFDADDDTQWAGLWNMAASLVNKQGIVSYIEASRRGGHLWFFTPKLAGIDARRFGKQLLANHDLTEMDIELFPKQDQLGAGAGSCVRLPLGVHQKSGKVYPFINLKGEPLYPTIRGQIVALANPVRVPRHFIEDTLFQIPEPISTPHPTPEFNLSPATGDTLSETIISSITVYDFVSRYVELDSAGRGLCPFHDDTHASFQVNTKDNYWNCYAGCGGGTVIHFWRKWRIQNGEDDSFKATIKDLAQMLL